MIGSIEHTIEKRDVPTPGSMVIFTGVVKDPTGNILLRKSDIASADFAVMERIIDSSGIQRLEPKEIPWQPLLSDEYDLFDELQPKGQISTCDYTFRYQPSGDRWPMFSGLGKYEVWFRFKRHDTTEDDIRLIYVVNVGGVSGVRRLE